MGRLDEAAKCKVVELRKAGLSFRKIKAVLELENIKVSAQAIYLFLREFHGRPPGRVRPVEAGSIASTAQVQARPGESHAGAQEGWSNIHLQNLLRGTSSQHAGFSAAADFPKQTNSETSTQASGSGGGQPEQTLEGDKDENDIQIISVTSLAQSSQQRGLQSNVRRTERENVSSTGTSSGAFMRRRVTPSPATNPILAARKRLLDKALSHRMKVASLPRRDQSSIQGPNVRTAVTQQPDSYNLTNEKTVMEDQPAGGSAPRRFLSQRPGLSLRSIHPPLRVGIRLPNRSPDPSTAPGATVIHLHNPGHGAAHSEGNPSPQQVVQDASRRDGLPDQIETLGSEVRSLTLAVKMLMEQQCRLEREQAQQTHIQRQILSTLQSLASKQGCCSSVRQQHNKTPSPSSLPAASPSTSFNQETFSYNQSTYTHCNQNQPAYNSLDNMEPIQTFKLPGLSPNMNGFPACSNADSLPLSYTPPQKQPYVTAYPQQSTQTLMVTYAQPYASTYNTTHSQTFRRSESKSCEFPNSCPGGTLQDCSASMQPAMESNHSPQDQQANIIKVEGP
ncbi:uncharacterized protein LOC117527803 [Thalassophryne amazonica]|uniref:uncharacterized protein LOC117527803 n=1 Tax=Thalassophryne amazonica TaxID=390379 RepID=UPI00147124C7|nr:uncharacterized protein LOC117527803 [Thalassophryne amazonica]